MPRSSPKANRRTRTRTYGGGGGAEPRGSPLLARLWCKCLGVRTPGARLHLDWLPGRQPGSALVRILSLSAILNGGVYRPLTLRKLAPGTAPSPGRQVLQESTSRTMLDLMRLNVTEGTGARADQLGLRVGGKTGTATKLVGGRYQEGKNVANLASFAAIFPTDGALGDDRYLVLIMMDAPKPNAADHGITTGAFTAAPVAGRVIDRIAPFVGVRRVIVTAELGAKPKPDAAALGANER